MADSDLYARVSDGKILEFPVLELHIRNRAHPFEWYTKCEVETKPELPAFHSYEEHVSLVDGKVKVSYTLIPLTLQQILDQAWAKVESENPSLVGTNELVLPISEVDPNVIRYIFKLVQDLAQKKMDEFAQSKYYDNMNSLCGYYNSVIDVYKEESSRGIYLRDLTWTKLNEYQNKVLSAAVVVPRTVSDFEEILPQYTWTD